VSEPARGPAADDGRAPAAGPAAQARTGPVTDRGAEPLKEPASSPPSGSTAAPASPTGRWPTTWPGRPLILGIVNVTPDSFSDGGRYFRWEKAVEHGLRLADEGADLLDIGGESTHPGAQAVPVEEELRRVLPVVRALTGELSGAAAVPLCIDTRHAEVARQALALGACGVNDVSALSDPQMASVVAGAGSGLGGSGLGGSGLGGAAGGGLLRGSGGAAGVILMHMQGEPATMQEDPRYDDVVSEVVAFLRERAARAEAAGIDADRIWVDPGIGFGKTLPHNLALLRALPQIAALGFPVVIGTSRKRFIGELSAATVDDRVPGSLAAAGLALALRRSVVRVHDVAATRQYLTVRAALERPGGAG
jgi:dihydropteroate synthase